MKTYPLRGGTRCDLWHQIGHASICNMHDGGKMIILLPGVTHTTKHNKHSCAKNGRYDHNMSLHDIIVHGIKWVHNSGMPMEIRDRENV